MTDHCLIVMIGLGIAIGFSVTIYDVQELSELLPDARDDITRKERVVLFCLLQTQQEFKDHNVPTITLCGQVLEHIDMGEAQFRRILAKMKGPNQNSGDPTRAG